MSNLTTVETETQSPPNTTTKAVKPGYKTTEGWFTAIAMTLGALYMLGIVAPDGASSMAKAVAFLASALTAMGYSVSRGIAKK